MASPTTSTTWLHEDSLSTVVWSFPALSSSTLPTSSSQHRRNTNNHVPDPLAEQNKKIITSLKWKLEDQQLTSTQNILTETLHLYCWAQRCSTQASTAGQSQSFRISQPPLSFYYRLPAHQERRGLCGLRIRWQNGSRFQLLIVQVKKSERSLNELRSASGKHVTFKFNLL